MRKKEITTIDLFCGAGGATTGLEEALRRKGLRHRGVAVNHWRVAVDTMRANHPDVDAIQMSVEEAVPAELVPGGIVDLLWASPSCTHHSRAKGGRPRSNQLRSQPELILTWLDQLFVRRIIVENVPEFVEWGPLNKDGRPIKSKFGECFRAWVAAIEARNYIVEWRVVNCADYGDATTRRRFFLKAVRKGCGKITWPEAQYAENPQPDLFCERKPWRGIKECLDFSDIGKSIFNRKNPLAKNRLRRIEEGLRKFCGLDFQMDMLGAGGPDDCRVRSLDKPMATQHCSNRTAIVRPFIVNLRNNENVQSIDRPVKTISAGGQHHALCQPFIVNNFEHGAPRSVEKPVHALTTGNHVMLCQPFVIDHTKHGKARSVNKPIPSQTTKDHVSMITPLVLGQHGAANCRPVSEPCPTVATKGAIRMITPIVIGQFTGSSAKPVTKPLGTITTTSRGIRLVTPFVVDNANGGIVRGSHDPMNTITVKDQHMGVFPMLEDGRIIDVYIRMLKPSELAAAHSFPKDYILTGNRGDQVKQIGNLVPVMTAAAMCECDLEAVKKGGRNEEA